MVNFKLLALLFSSFFSYLDAGTISMPESLCPDDNRSMTEVNFLLDDDDEEDLELDEDDDDFLLPSSFLSEKWSRFFFLRSNRRLSSSLRLRLISLYFDLSLGILSLGNLSPKGMISMPTGFLTPSMTSADDTGVIETEGLMGSPIFFACLVCSKGNAKLAGLLFKALIST